MTYVWIDTGDGRKVYRKMSERHDNRSSLPTPMIIGDLSDPIQSQADGKWYSSKAALRASYKASGNPAGKEYIEVGNEDISGFTPPKRDRKADREAIERAMATVESGDAPSVLTTDQIKT